MIQRHAETIRPGDTIIGLGEVRATNHARYKHPDHREESVQIVLSGDLFILQCHPSASVPMRDTQVVNEGGEARR